MFFRNYLSKQNNKVAKKSSASREDLLKAAQDSYSSASKSGGSNYASVTSYLASSTAAAKDLTFDTWSDSELKSYLDSYGVKNYQGSTTNELRGTYNVRVPGVALCFSSPGQSKLFLSHLTFAYQKIFRRSNTDRTLHSHRSEAGTVLSLRNKCAWRVYLCTDSKRRPMGL